MTWSFGPPPNMPTEGTTLLAYEGGQWLTFMFDGRSWWSEFACAPDPPHMVLHCDGEPFVLPKWYEVAGPG